MTDQEYENSLAANLAPTVDQLRHLASQFGIRPYRVFLVHWQWPKTRGIGTPTEIARIEILPTPRVADMQGASLALAALGMTEMGGISVSKISPRYSEADLMGLTPDLVDPQHPRTLKSGVEFFWEIVESRRTTPAPKPRRFAPSAVPMLSRSGFEWRVSLTKQGPSYEGPMEVAR